MTSRFAQSVKVVVANALYYTGALWIWQLIALRNRAVVLMYHRVMSEDERRVSGSHPGIVVTRDTFAWQMALLKRRFRVLTAAQLAHHLRERLPLPHSSCVITFDDGWRDNFTQALPVLRQFGLPAIIFLPVNFIGQRRLFWRESLTHLLVEAVQSARTNKSLRLRLVPVLGEIGLDHVLDIEQPDPRPAIIEAIAALPRLGSTSASRIMQAIESLGGHVDPAQTPDTFVNWDEVREMAAAGITFGGHGAEHVLLGEVSLENAASEIQTARDQAQAQTTAAFPAFSYPNGSFTAGVVEMVRTSGFRIAFTTREGSIRCSDNPLTLKRINIHESATSAPPLFLARILRLF